MGKLLTGVMIVLGLSFTGRELWLSILADDLDYAAIYAESRRLDERARDRRIFIEVRDATLRALGTGEITLRDACRQIDKASKVLYPRYVETVNELIQGMGPEAKLADNLVGHFRNLTRQEADFAGAIPELERQLAEMGAPSRAEKD